MNRDIKLGVRVLDIDITWYHPSQEKGAEQFSLLDQLDGIVLDGVKSLIAFARKHGEGVRVSGEFKGRLHVLLCRDAHEVMVEEQKEITPLAYDLEMVEDYLWSVLRSIDQEATDDEESLKNCDHLYSTARIHKAAHEYLRAIKVSENSFEREKARSTNGTVMRDYLRNSHKYGSIQEYLMKN